MARYNQFEDFGLSRKLQEAVAHAKFEKPTELQKQVIPLVLEGHDVIFEARSGMGKSACFAIPFLQQWLRNRNDRGLIITGSAGSVRQMGKVISRLCPTLKARVLKFTARDDYFYPDMLDRAPMVVLEFDVLDRFIKREKEYVKRTHMLGLDEFDVLLKNEEPLSSAVAQLSGDRRTLICANELTEQVLERGRWYCNPNVLEKVKLARPEARWSEEKVQLHYLLVDDQDRFEQFAKLIIASPEAIVLVVTGSDRVSRYVVDRLQSAKMPGELLAYASQLDVKQSIVDKITQAGQGVLVGCEAAMNALTMPKIDHLISWDLPEQIESYFRRIDRFAYHGALAATVLIDRPRQGAVRVLERRLGRDMVDLGSSQTSEEAKESDDQAEGAGPADSPKKDRGLLIPERFRQAVFAKGDEVNRLAPDGVDKTLGSKFVPARKRR